MYKSVHVCVREREIPKSQPGSHSKGKPQCLPILEALVVGASRICLAWERACLDGRCSKIPHVLHTLKSAALGSGGAGQGRVGLVSGLGSSF